MKKWSEDIEINAPIEEVWKLFDGSLADMQKIMSNMIENEPINGTENGVGSVYRQTYQERKRVQSYDVETIEYQNDSDEKRLKIGFNVPKRFEITSLYELKKLDDNKTYFRYTTTNNPLKWHIKFLLTLTSDKLVLGFVKQVKNVAEKEVRTKQEQE